MTIKRFGVRMDGKALQVHTSPDYFELKEHDRVQTMLAVNDMFFLAVSMMASLIYEVWQVSKRSVTSSAWAKTPWRIGARDTPTTSFSDRMTP